MTMPRFPPVVAERIMRFLDSGMSGTIEIQVHEGRIRGGKIVESFRVAEVEIIALRRPRLDVEPCEGQDSGT